jgi:hypothetical protein
MAQTGSPQTVKEKVIDGRAVMDEREVIVLVIDG